MTVKPRSGVRNVVSSEDCSAARLYKMRADESSTHSVRAVFNMVEKKNIALTSRVAAHWARRVLDAASRSWCLPVAPGRLCPEISRVGLSWGRERGARTQPNGANRLSGWWFPGEWRYPALIEGRVVVLMARAARLRSRWAAAKQSLRFEPNGGDLRIMRILAVQRK